MSNKVFFAAIGLLIGITAFGGCSKNLNSSSNTASSTPTAEEFGSSGQTAAQGSTPASSDDPEQKTESALGSVVSSPFQLTLEQSALNAILLHGAVMKSLQGEIKQDLPDFAITDPFAVSISGIHLDVKYAFSAPVLNNRTQQWEFTTRSISADLTIDSVVANETFQVSQNGVTIVDHLNGSCGGVHLTLPAGASSASGTIQLGLNAGTGKPELTLTSFKPDWKPGAWKVTAINCQGPSGFGDLVSQAASQRLSEIDPYVAVIRQQIQVELAKLVSGPIHFEMDVSPTVSVALTANHFSSPAPSDFPGPVTVQGEARFLFKKVSRALGCAQVISSSIPMPAQGSDMNCSANRLRLPIETVQALITCGYYDGALVANFDSTKVPAFSSLVSSWIKDLIVWPDLLSFDAHSLFAFRVTSFDLPTFSNARSLGPNLIGLDAHLPLELEVDAPVDATHTPYVQLRTNFSGQMDLSLVNGLAVVRIARGSHMHIGYEWYPDYVHQYHPDQRIWMDPIESSANDYFQKTGLQLNVPSLKVGNDLTLAPQNGHLDQDGIVDLDIQLTLNTSN
ncbi:MAG: hypothetical protein P4M08_14980 [Oligoflexia bacterium]|nr:hypothetical protein [Oligoflexia bacterium]